MALLPSVTETFNPYCYFKKNFRFPNRNLPHGESYSLSHTQCSPVKGEEDRKREKKQTCDGESINADIRGEAQISPNLTVRREGNRRNESAVFFF